jgi:hypothetical protein
MRSEPASGQRGIHPGCIYWDELISVSDFRDTCLISESSQLLRDDGLNERLIGSFESVEQILLTGLGVKVQGEGEEDTKEERLHGGASRNTQRARPSLSHRNRRGDWRLRGGCREGKLGT